MDKNNILEEVTVTPVIRDIERLINKLISSIWYLTRGMASGLVLLLKFNIKHLKLILPIVIVAMIIGFASVNFIPRTYSSNLLLRLNVESEGQLYSDVGYFNSLVQEEKLEELAKLFQISEEDASSLKNFEIKPHSSYREKLDIINNIYRELDSATYQHIDFDLLLEGGFSAVSSRFMIEVESTDQKIFSKLESSLLAYLERVPELQKMKQDEVSRLFYEKEILIEEMNRLDTLKKVYNQALLEKAKSDKGASAGTTVMLGQQKEGSSLNPLDIYNKYLYYSKEVSRIDQMMSELDNVYDVHAHFSDFGAKSGAGRSLRAMYAAILGLILSYALISLFAVSKKGNA